MKNRGVCWAALILAGFFGGLSARADCVTEFFKSIPKDTVRRNCWPVPFVYPARQAAREPFATMVANGWERQNMLTDEHFDPLTGKLTPAGEAKVQTVLNDVPQHHRYVFVHRAERGRKQRRGSTRSSSSLCGRFRRPSIRRSWSPPNRPTAIPPSEARRWGGSSMQSVRIRSSCPRTPAARPRQRRPLRAAAAEQCEDLVAPPPGEKGIIPNCAASAFGPAWLDAPAASWPPCSC